jgi:hypothetical protein
VRRQVRDREERAEAEKKELTHKLELQRVELQKAAGALQLSEDRARGEVADVQRSTASSRNAIDSSARSQAESDRSAYQVRCGRRQGRRGLPPVPAAEGGGHGHVSAAPAAPAAAPHACAPRDVRPLPLQADLDQLNKELGAARAELARLRTSHKETEAALRKARKRAEQDVEVQIGEYDADVGAKEEELGKARGEYEEVLRQLGEYSRGYGEMLAERLDYEAREKAAADARFQVGGAALGGWPGPLGGQPAGRGGLGRLGRWGAQGSGAGLVREAWRARPGADTPGMRARRPHRRRCSKSGRTARPASSRCVCARGARKQLPSATCRLRLLLLLLWPLAGRAAVAGLPSAARVRLHGPCRHPAQAAWRSYKKAKEAARKKAKKAAEKGKGGAKKK